CITYPEHAASATNAIAEAMPDSISLNVANPLNMSYFVPSRAIYGLSSVLWLLVPRHGPGFPGGSVPWPPESPTLVAQRTPPCRGGATTVGGGPQFRGAEAIQKLDEGDT